MVESVVTFDDDGTCKAVTAAGVEMHKDMLPVLPICVALVMPGEIAFAVDVLTAEEDGGGGWKRCL